MRSDLVPMLQFCTNLATKVVKGNTPECVGWAYTCDACLPRMKHSYKDSTDTLSPKEIGAGVRCSCCLTLPEVV